MTTIYEGRNHILIHTGYQDPARHRHMAVQIIIALENEITIFHDNQVIPCRGAMIPSGVSHHIKSNGYPVLVLLYDNTTGISAQIRNMQCVATNQCITISERFNDFKNGKIEYSQFHHEFLELLGLDIPVIRVTDSRILDAMAYVRSRLYEEISCEEVAKAVCLSQSRFSHLFRKETGMTFASYLIYQRILYVYAQRFRGKSLTESAYEAGFSSSSHFSDVNRRVFGLAANDITRDWMFKIAEI